jgi:haloalkane dehalogenase
MISAAEPSKHKVDVLGRQMAYVEMGSGDPIVFLHGNPTSSYLWRNIMPAVADAGRCIAIDLIGMGDSDKLDASGPEAYTFVEHSRYLDAAFEALGISTNVTLVIHDWGSALGFYWANRHRDAIKGICFMEAIVRPLTWDEFPTGARQVFEGFRSPAGEEMVLQKNLFVEAVLPGSILRDLSPEEMAVYRRPFAAEGEDRRPTLTWPRQIPLDGEPAEVVDIVADYAAWLSKDESVPKLFVRAEPGALITENVLSYCRNWPNQREVTVPGNHFLQEDSPAEIGAALRDWMGTL